MEAPSWKQQLAVASFLAVLVSLVVRLLVPGYVEPIGIAAQFVIAVAAIVFAFFLPYLWWRTMVGYVGGVVFGIVGVVTSAGTLITRVAPGELPGESSSILVPALIFSLLLILGSVLAWREG